MTTRTGMTSVNWNKPFPKAFVVVVVVSAGICALEALVNFTSLEGAPPVFVMWCLVLAATGLSGLRAGYRAFRTKQLSGHSLDLFLFLMIVAFEPVQKSDLFYIRIGLNLTVTYLDANIGVSLIGLLLFEWYRRLGKIGVFVTPFVATSELALASLWERFAGRLIDYLVACGPLVVGGIVSDNNKNEKAGEVLVIFGVLFFVVYMLFADGLNKGQSLGKRAMKTATVDATARTPCTFWKSLVRNILMILLPIVDGFSFSKRNVGALATLRRIQ